MSNLIGLVTALSQSTTDRSELSASDIDRWAKMYRDFLMIEREGTLAEVFDTAQEWIGTSRFFPTVADLAPLIEQRVLRRREREIVVAAQDAAVPLPELPGGDVDWSKVATRDLPPGYDYSQDEHWQRGMDLLGPIFDGKPAMSPMGKFVKQVYDRMSEHRPIGFQGASKPREMTCPSCSGARWLRLGGWDGHPNDIGRTESKYIMCRTCCPNGRYSEQAEREAARKAAV